MQDLILISDKTSTLEKSQSEGESDLTQRDVFLVYVKDSSESYPILIRTIDQKKPYTHVILGYPHVFPNGEPYKFAFWSFGEKKYEEVKDLIYELLRHYYSGSKEKVFSTESILFDRTVKNKRLFNKSYLTLGNSVIKTKVSYSAEGDPTKSYFYRWCKEGDLYTWKHLFDEKYDEESTLEKTKLFSTLVDSNC